MSLAYHPLLVRHTPVSSDGNQHSLYYTANPYQSQTGMIQRQENQPYTQISASLGKRSYGSMMELDQADQTYPPPFYTDSTPLSWPACASSYEDALAYSQTQPAQIDSDMLSMSCGLNDTGSRTHHRTPQPATSPNQSYEDKTCPLLTGDINSCDPSRCGPDAPCLNFKELPPIEECTSIPCLNSSSHQASSTEQDRTHIAPSQYNKNTASPLLHAKHHKIGSRPSHLTQVEITESVPKPQQLPPKQSKVSRTSSQPSSTAIRSSSKNKRFKSKAAEAHSLVEKKYRENLNAKLLELHSLLQTTRFNVSTAENNTSEYETEDHDDEHRASQTVNQRPLLQRKRPSLESQAASSRAGDSKTATGNESAFKKSTVLTHALDYVQNAESEITRLNDELVRLSSQVASLKDENCRLVYSVKAAGIDTLPTPPLPPQETSIMEWKQTLEQEGWNARDDGGAWDAIEEEDAMLRAQDLLRKMQQGRGLERMMRRGCDGPDVRMGMTGTGVIA